MSYQRDCLGDGGTKGLIERHPMGALAASAFVILSIQQTFPSLLSVCQQVGTQRLDSKYLWGWKRAALDNFIQLHEDGELKKIIELKGTQPSRAEVVLAVSSLTDLVGLGIPKASFLLQLAGWPTGCLDVNWLMRLGYGKSAWKLPRFQRARTSRIIAYLDAVEEHGGSEHLWNQWCGIMAGKWPRTFATADDASYWHIRCMHAFIGGHA